MTRRLGGVAAALGVLLLAWYLWPTDARAVRARVTSLVDALNAGANETDLARIARAASLASALTSDVVVVVDDARRLEGREMVLGVARQVAQTQRDIQVEVLELSVAIGADRTTAIADIVLRVDRDSYHEGRLHLVKRSGAWLVQRAEVQRPLARPNVAR